MNTLHQMIASFGLVSGVIAFPSAALSAETSVPASAALSTATTSLGELLDNPEAKAVLEKHVPTLIANPQIEMARAMTLKQLQSYTGDQVTNDVLAKIDADLSKLTPKK